MIVKVLSVQEPYASLIVDGFKFAETRSWATNFRGRLYIQASKKEYPGWKQNPNVNWSIPSKERGYIIGYVDVIDCVKANEITDKNEMKLGFYGEDRYAWVLQDAHRIKPVECKGKLGLFNFEMEEN